ncbi:Ycf66 family protein [Leptolyngbya ohadii]|uniref:Ycf66 family protein n=1 Tax=Leptolyngbya ohadii TaxID=1962290 RepID=UPI000B59DD1D|nr:Ycf66 family protein [Leptolyngbya ohadii]
MVNVGFGLPSVLGIALILAGAGLYFLRTMRPALARDQDIFFAAIALLCGGILFFQGWRLDPILQFAQFLSTGAAAWFAIEAVRLRGIATEQAKRATPVVDEERPVSTRYRAELDDLPPIDERRRVSPARRIQGSRDSRSSYDSGYDDYADDRRRSRDDRYGSDGSRRRAARPLPPDRSQASRDWDDDYDRPSSRNRDVDSRSGDASSYDSSYDGGYDSGSYNSSTYSSGSSGGSYDSGSYSTSDTTYSTSDTDASSRSRRPRSSDASPRRRGGSSRAGSDTTSDYVDYQPIDYPEEP